ncbi:MAG: dihydrolipoyl dehydrogenase [Deltaproteobacteria bacterium]|nr:dihydrolipoyl dehydrogenase [Deltaproteobacteria bacterium]
MKQHDLVIVGAGPAGYQAAVRAAQLGLDTAVIEVEPELGGTCLRVGCIPSKALLEATERYDEARHGLAAFGVDVPSVGFDLGRMLGRKTAIVKQLTQGVAYLMRKHGVTRYAGRGRFVGPGRIAVDGPDRAVTEVAARRVLVATGSRVAELRGVALDGDRIGTSTEALSYPEVPAHLVVIGAGVIGLELGSVWARLGARVTVLEYLGRILPGMDAELAAEAKKLFERQGMTFRLGVKVTGARRSGAGVEVEVEGQEPVACDRVLVAVGRVPNTQGLGLEHVGITLDARGRIPVDARFRTTASEVYAVGDVIAGPMLAHKAEHEAVACVEGIVSGHCHVNYAAIPSIVYTHPEFASVGKMEEELTAEGVPFRKGVFPFSANGRARALGTTDGRVKMLAHAETDRILGVHVLGPRAGDLIAEAAVAIEFGASAEDVARSCHAHPTLAEAMKEAALSVHGRPLNL